VHCLFLQGLALGPCGRRTHEANLYILGPKDSNKSYIVQPLSFVSDFQSYIPSPSSLANCFALPFFSSRQVTQSFNINAFLILFLYLESLPFQNQSILSISLPQFVTQFEHPTLPIDYPLRHVRLAYTFLQTRQGGVH
jgi:hypothetical protein